NSTNSKNFAKFFISSRSRKCVPVVRQLAVENVDSRVIPNADLPGKWTQRPLVRVASIPRRPSSCRSSALAGRFAPCPANRPVHATPNPLRLLQIRYSFFPKQRALPKPLSPELKSAKCNTTYARHARSAPELMQLRQTKTLCVFNQHHAGIRDIDTDLENSRADQRLCLTAPKALHDLLF